MMMLDSTRRLAHLLLAALAGLSITAAEAASAPQRSIAMHGEPALPADFSHFDYVNPDAPRGGRLTHGVLGGFDSLNPYIVRGRAAKGLRELVFEPLMARNFNEPFSLYGLIAETIEVAPDNTWVEFTLNPKARFSDGEPVKPEDIIHTVEMFAKHSRTRSSYQKVARMEVVGERRVRMHFADGKDKELPLILALTEVIPKHAVSEELFTSGSLTPLVGSGPYEVARVEPPRRVTYRFRDDYWAKDLPSRRGHFNFSEVVYEYFSDSNALFEAFKTGLYDFRYEADPVLWATGYDFPAVRRGDVILNEVEFGLPKPLRAYVFNTRQPPFDNEKVREAVTLLFDFEWINKTLYADRYTRTQSYFPASELSSHHTPASAAEHALLGDAVAGIEPEILEGTHALPATDGRGRDRETLRAAMRLFKEAGYEVSNGKLVNGQTGKPLVFTLTVQTGEQEKLGLTFATLLQRAGVEMRVRNVDSSQYEQLRQTYDFQMIDNTWYNSLSPGNEQFLYWGSVSGAQPGSRNYMGVNDPVVDDLIRAQLAATSREELVAATRALDRKLLSSNHILPLFHAPALWLAHWKRIARPESPTLYGSMWETWWVREGARR